MLRKYKQFLRGVSLNAFGKAGVVLTTSSFVSFIMFELARFLGILTNSYIGLITYLLFPLLFILGLILIPVGWYKFRQTSDKTIDGLFTERFGKSDTERSFFGSRIAITIAFLTIGNIIFIGAISSLALGFMDTPEFCGTACHTVMSPEWTTYQKSSHAKVACVECHVGEGAGALVDAKLNGMRQMILASLNLYNRPIPTPVHTLRPARETCEKCHWPEKFYGDRVINLVTFGKDRDSTPKYTTLVLKIDAASGSDFSGIHWHISQDNEIRYTSKGNKREDMIRVDIKQSDGSFKRFTNKKLAGLSEPDTQKEERALDCVDCHNRATHVYQDPEKAVDELLESGIINNSLPFIKREALAAVRAKYADKVTAMAAIEKNIRSFYLEELTGTSDSVDRAVTALQEIYDRNIHPEMKIRWGAYPSLIGHRNDSGCFRCHNENLVDEENKTIPHNCTLCHSILSYDEDEPFKYLQPVNEKDPTAKMHKYLQEEFLGVKKK